VSKGIKFSLRRKGASRIKNGWVSLRSFIVEKTYCKHENFKLIIVVNLILLLL